MHYVYYDKKKTTKKARYAHHDLYHNKKWQDLRKYKLSDSPLCEQCGKSARDANMETTLHIDHIIEHEGNTDLFYNFDNLQTLCDACHASKTAEANHYKKVKKTVSDITVHIFIDPKNNDLDQLQTFLSYPAKTSAFYRSVIKSNTNNIFKVKNEIIAEKIRRKYIVVNRYIPNFKIQKVLNG